MLVLCMYSMSDSWAGHQPRFANSISRCMAPEFVFEIELSLYAYLIIVLMHTSSRSSSEWP